MLDAPSYGKVCRMQSMGLPRSLHVPSEPESVAAVREFVAGCCSDWGLDAAVDVAVLLASELATNAVRYARTPVTVWLAQRPDRIVLSVEDASPEPATVRHPGALEEGGRGLELVEALADGWGERGRGNGKLVWAEIRTAVPNT